jgi:hypothetical protein
MRLWLRRKNQKKGKPYAVHEFSGKDTTCLAVLTKGMNLEHYEVTGKVQTGERVCQACQYGIAVRNDKF